MLIAKQCKSISARLLTNYERRRNMNGSTREETSRGVRFCGVYENAQ